MESQALSMITNTSPDRLKEFKSDIGLLGGVVGAFEDNLID